MKAWIVEDRFDEWVTLVHAKTTGKAKVEVASWFGSDFLSLNAKRLPGLDDKPITYQNALDAGFQYTTDELGDEFTPEYQFINDCNCDICKGIKNEN